LDGPLTWAWPRSARELTVPQRLFGLPRFAKARTPATSARIKPFPDVERGRRGGTAKTAVGATQKTGAFIR